MAHDKRNDGFNYRAAVEMIRPALAARLWPADDDLPLFEETQSRCQDRELQEPTHRAAAVSLIPRREKP